MYWDGGSVVNTMADDKLHELFLKRLELAMNESGLRGTALASKAKTTKQNIHKWCSGKSFPKTQHLSDLAEALGKPPAWFFTEEELPSQQKVDLTSLSVKLKEAGKLLDQIVRDQ